MDHAYSSFFEAEMKTGSITTKEISLSAPPIEFEIETSTTRGVLGLPFSVFKLVKDETINTQSRFDISENDDILCKGVIVGRILDRDNYFIGPKDAPTRRECFQRIFLEKLGGNTSETYS